MTATKPDPVGAQPEDPPWWRLLFLLVQGPGGQWWRGFALMALVGLLLVGVLAALLVFAGGAGGALGVGSLVLAWRGRHRLGRR
ncbi:MAG: hypothetical protein ACRDRS_17130 [Pseudonocardiaceae bacterium]